jgi:hypothetical protein
VAYLKIFRRIWNDRMKHIFHTKGPGYITITVFGVCIGIQANDPCIINKIRCFLPPGSITAKNRRNCDVVYVISAGGEHSLYRISSCNGVTSRVELIKKAGDVEILLTVLESDLHFQVACHARTALFVHAGVVGFKDLAICLPGRSYVGKSSLVKELVQAGATYYSDEYAPLDTDGNVYPYPRPLSIRDEKGKATSVPIDTITKNIGRKSIPVGMIVHTQYRHRGRWQPVGITRGEALLSLVDNTILARKYPKEMLKAAAKVVSNAVALKSDRGEADVAANWLLRHFGSLVAP